MLRKILIKLGLVKTPVWELVDLFKSADIKSVWSYAEYYGVFTYLNSQKISIYYWSGRNKSTVSYGSHTPATFRGFEALVLRRTISCVRAKLTKNNKITSDQQNKRRREELVKLFKGEN